MFHKLVSHNEDLKRLVDKGYAVGFDSNYLLVYDIPYLGSDKSLHYGVIVTKLVPTDNNKFIQEDHQIFFAGGVPHGLNGEPIQNLGGGLTTLALSELCADVAVQRSFSNKPAINGVVCGIFPDFFAKIESYVTIISGPAMELHGITPLTFRTREHIPDTVFKFHDSLTSRAEITDLAVKFKDDVIAVIGLGGTGSYILDFLVKTPVREIKSFDLDPYYVHNAFRSPGKLDNSELCKQKVDVYKSRYENFRHGLSFIPKFIDATCEDDFDNVTFAFVCVDKGSSRAGIFDLLISKGIPFIDVGMDLSRKEIGLGGMARATYFSVSDAVKLRDAGLAQLVDGQNDMYKTNIQISELNALNACLAVIKFKQIRGFYFEEVASSHMLFNISDMKICGD